MRIRVISPDGKTDTYLSAESMETTSGTLIITDYKESETKIHRYAKGTWVRTQEESLQNKE